MTWKSLVSGLGMGLFFFGMFLFGEDGAAHWVGVITVVAGLNVWHDFKEASDD